MRLREVKIKNFRKIEYLVVAFPKGLSVIVGENNTGKTTIVDALRLMLMPSRDFDTLRISEDDFRSAVLVLLSGSPRKTIPPRRNTLHFYDY